MSIRIGRKWVSLVLLVAFVIMGRGLGASGAYGSLVAAGPMAAPKKKKAGR